MSKVKFVGKLEIVGELDAVTAVVETLGLDGDLYEAVIDPCIGDGRVYKPFSKRLRRKAQRTVSKAILRYEAEAA